MKIQLTAQIVDDNGEELAEIVTKEAEVQNVTAYGNKEQFLKLFHRYETAVIRERESLTAEVTKEYLDCATDLGSILKLDIWKKLCYNIETKE